MYRPYAVSRNSSTGRTNPLLSVFVIAGTSNTSRFGGWMRWRSPTIAVKPRAPRVPSTHVDRTDGPAPDRSDDRRPGRRVVDLLLHRRTRFRLINRIGDDIAFVQVGAGLMLALWDVSQMPSEYGDVGHGPIAPPMSLGHNVATADAVSAWYRRAPPPAAESISEPTTQAWGGTSARVADPTDSGGTSSTIRGSPWPTTGLSSASDVRP